MSFPRRRESRKIISNIDIKVIYLKNKPIKTLVFIGFTRFLLS
ncbi:hypothetical protein [Rickettsia asembonensis]|nr:hypothetical protein [Rickettsia asembonensis]